MGCISPHDGTGHRIYKEKIMDILSEVLIAVLAVAIFLIGAGCCLFITSAILKMLLLDD
jgi:hypothetical protein